MKRTLVILAAVVGFATVASAATLTISSENSSNVAQSVFFVGDTIVLRVAGDPQGASSGSTAGTIVWNSALTTLVSGTRADFLAGSGEDGPACSNGSCLVFGESILPAATGQSSTALVTLVAAAVGNTLVSFGGENLDFFSIQQYPPDPNANPAGVTTASFTVIVPEPATAALLGLGLLGLVFGGRRRA